MRDTEVLILTVLGLPTQDEGIVVRLVAINRILGQGALAPGVDTTHTVDIEINIQIDKTATLDVLRMTGGCI